MSQSDYAPLIRRFFQAVMDAEHSPTPSHKEARVKAAEAIRTDLYHASGDITAKLSKADRWFARYGGWGQPPADKPKVYDERAAAYVGWLKDYEIIRSAIKVGEVML